MSRSLPSGAVKAQRVPERGIGMGSATRASLGQLRDILQLSLKGLATQITGLLEPTLQQTCAHEHKSSLRFSSSITSPRRTVDGYEMGFSCSQTTSGSARMQPFADRPVSCQKLTAGDHFLALVAVRDPKLYITNVTLTFESQLRPALRLPSHD